MTPVWLASRRHGAYVRPRSRATDDTSHTFDNPGSRGAGEMRAALALWRGCRHGRGKRWDDDGWGGGDVARVPLAVTETDPQAIHPHTGGIGKGTVMTERDLTSAWARTVLVVAVGALLSAGVVNVLIAVTESVLWPVFVGVGWVVVAAGVVVEAEAAAPSRSRTHPASPVPLAVTGPARRR